MLHSVFIYGSLLPGQRNHHVAFPYIQAVRPGRIAGRLVDVGAYPALLRDEEARRTGRFVRGMWIEVNRNGLKAMDELEEFAGIEEPNDYDRVWTDDLDETGRGGWVYIWESARGCPPVPDDFWPDYLMKKHGF